MKPTIPDHTPTDMNQPAITDQQVARSMKTSVKFLRENPELLEACRSAFAARRSLRALKSFIREDKKKGGAS